MVSRMVTAIYVESLDQSQAFYSQLLGLVPIFEADWIVQLSSPENPSINLTLQPRDHELVPEAFRAAPRGTSLAFGVPDCDAVFEKAQSMGLEIVQEPTNEDYGQRRFLTVDPDGLLVDVGSNCEPSPEFRARYMGDNP